MSIPVVAAIGIPFILVAAILAPPARAQTLYVSCTVDAAESRVGEVEFGLSVDALDGIDALDEPLPPAAPDQEGRVYLIMPDTTESPVPAWRRDIRAFTPETKGRVTIWPMTVDGCPADGSITISALFAVEDAPPYSLGLIRPDGSTTAVQHGDAVRLPCPAATMTVYWELRYNEQVPTAPTTWGGAKTIYH